MISTSAPLEYEYIHGFPIETDEQQAIRTALDAAEAWCRDGGYEPDGASAEVRRTPEHEANGEFIVWVNGTRLRPNQP